MALKAIGVPVVRTVTPRSCCRTSKHGIDVSPAKFRSFSKKFAIVSQLNEKKQENVFWPWYSKNCGVQRKFRSFIVTNALSSLKDTEQMVSAMPVKSPRKRIQNFFATCIPGLEEVLALELLNPCIGACDITPGRSGVYFSGTMETAYRANLWLRTGVRVLHKLAEDDLNPERPAGDTVYDFVKNAVDWTQLIDPTVSAAKLPHSGSRKRQVSLSKNFSVDARVWDCTNVTNSNLVKRRAIDAVCDALRDYYEGLKPTPPDRASEAELPLFISLYRDKAILYRDTSGSTLHKRGFRDVMHKASLNEGLAAGLLLLAGWRSHQRDVSAKKDNESGVQSWWSDAVKENDKKGWKQRVIPSKISGGVLLDPMCGSGTLLIEAALIAKNKAPGLFRETWPFQTWPDFDWKVWEKIHGEAVLAEREFPSGIHLIGNDIHPGALSLCRKDAENAGVLDILQLSCKDIRDFKPQIFPSLVVVNPPWGDRLEGGSESEESLVATWKALGEFFKSNCNNSEVFVLSGNSSVTQHLRMKSTKKYPVNLGGTDCRILHYHVLPPKPEGFIAPKRSFD